MVGAAPAVVLALVRLLAVEARPDDLVDASLVVPGVVVELRYATADNFTRRAIYPRGARCLLRRAVADRLARAAASLAPDGLALHLYDCYRPLAVQRQLWGLVPDERYVADPAKGSRHNRAAAVDVTLDDAHTHAPLAMPTAFDDFTSRAHRDSRDAPAAALAHRARLERALTDAGFVPLPTEWWHFDAPEWASWPLLDVPLDP